jgi:hypothetical protein
MNNTAILTITRELMIEQYRQDLIAAIAAVNVAAGIGGLRSAEALYEIEVAVSAFAAALERG